MFGIGQWELLLICGGMFVLLLVVGVTVAIVLVAARRGGRSDRPQ